MATSLPSASPYAAGIVALRPHDIPRIAWREGTDAARDLYERAYQDVLSVAQLVLCDDDVIMRDDPNYTFIIVVSGREHEESMQPSTAHLRQIQVRLQWVLVAQSSLRFDSGHMALDENVENISMAAELAIERGIREVHRLEYLSGLAHEMRTPISSILGTLSAIAENNHGDAELRKHFIETARDETLRLGRMVNGLFRISVGDLTNARRFRGRTNVGVVLEKAVAALAPVAWRKRILLTLQPGPDPTIGVSRDQATLLLANIIENAIKYGREGGNVHVAVRALDSIVQVTIDDDGPGIEEAERHKIFDLLHRGKSAKGIGSGIGLALVYALLRRVSGDVGIADSPLGGARFTVSLPAATAAEDEVREAVPALLEGEEVVLDARLLPLESIIDHLL